MAWGGGMVQYLLVPMVDFFSAPENNTQRKSIVGLNSLLRLPHRERLRARGGQGTRDSLACTYKADRGIRTRQRLKDACFFGRCLRQHRRQPAGKCSDFESVRASATSAFHVKEPPALPLT